MEKLKTLKVAKEGGIIKVVFIKIISLLKQFCAIAPTK